jgi:potassium efflux system protein
MIRKSLSIAAVVLLLVGGIVGLLNTTLHPRSVLHIALVGPMGGKDRAMGEAMLRGARLSLDQATKEDRLGEWEIKFHILDDPEDRKSALKVSSALVEQNEVLLVLGHFYPANCNVAGAVYEKNGIPAITASAVADPTFSDNDWYFRVTPSNQFDSLFIADYIKQGLGLNAASIISDNSLHSQSLAVSFKALADERGLALRGEWTFDLEDKELEEKLEDPEYNIANKAHGDMRTKYRNKVLHGYF